MAARLHVEARSQRAHLQFGRQSAASAHNIDRMLSVSLQPLCVCNTRFFSDHRNLFVGDGAGRVWIWSMDARAGVEHQESSCGPINGMLGREKQKSRLNTRSENESQAATIGERRVCINCARPFAGSETKAVSAKCGGGVAQTRLTCKNCGALTCEK